MLDKSLFVSDEIHERDVRLGDDEKHKLYFIEPTADEIHLFSIGDTPFVGDQDDPEYDEKKSAHEKKRVDRIVRLIANHLVTPDGKKALTFEQAKKLKFVVRMAIFTTILKLGGSVKKKTRTGDSGTS